MTPRGQVLPHPYLNRPENGFLLLLCFWRFFWRFVAKAPNWNSSLESIHCDLASACISGINS
jgi:hypothetical protein